jgi:hypothetical protein
MDSLQTPTAAAELIRAHLLLAREKLVAQQTRMEIELQQISQGIRSIDATIDMVCASDVVSVDSSTLQSGSADRPASPTLAEEASSPVNALPIEENQSSFRDLPASALRASSIKTTTMSSTGCQPLPSRLPSRRRSSQAAAQPRTPSSATLKRTAMTRRAGKARSTDPSNSPRAARRKTGWKKYLLKRYSNRPLTEVVMSVFRESPDAVLASSDLINRIFVPQIPKDIKATARDRLLNILSLRVADHQLERVGSGQYKLGGKPT